MNQVYQLKMPVFETPPLIYIEKTTPMLYEGKELGTFKDNLKTPIHRWFKYPAGYSYKFVQATFDLFGVSSGQWVYDPFSGSGTTLITAKQTGVNGYGVEAHSFVHAVADTKLYWEYDNLTTLERDLDKFLVECRSFIYQETESIQIEKVFPELVYKCYHPLDLKTLYLIRQFIMQYEINYHVINFLKLALTDTLRNAASAGTGWPYISPRENENPTVKNAFQVFQKTVQQMYQDLFSVASKQSLNCEIYNILGDSRDKQNLADGQINLAITSPPYLNNYDYADRTRLETYFWGITNSWKDITEKFRKKLMTAATTQIVRGHHDVETALNKNIADVAPHVYSSLQSSILELSSRRLEKGGKKDYDLMVALYFNDIFKIVSETYRVLAPGKKFCLVLGDSAPYGVHIQTDELIGQLGVAIGFSKYDYYQLRERGDKWKNNPQRHKIGLREGIIILSK